MRGHKMLVDREVRMDTTEIRNELQGFLKRCEDARMRRYREEMRRLRTVCVDYDRMMKVMARER